MVLPVIALDIFKLLLINFPPTQVDRYIIILMVLVKKFADRVDGVAVKFLYSRGRESHGDDPVSDIGEVEVETVFLVPVFRAAHYLAQEVHNFKWRSDCFIILSIRKA